MRKNCKLKRNSNGELFCKLHPVDCPTLYPLQGKKEVVKNPSEQTEMLKQQAEVINPKANIEQPNYDYQYNTQNFQPNQNENYYQPNQQNDGFTFNDPSTVNVTSNMPSTNYNAQNYPVVDYTQVFDPNSFQNNSYVNYPTSSGTTLVPSVNNLDSTTQNLLIRESMGQATQNQDVIISELSNESIDKLNTLNFLLESGVITYNDYFVKKRDLYFHEFEKDDNNKQ